MVKSPIKLAILAFLLGVKASPVLSSSNVALFQIQSENADSISEQHVQEYTPNEEKTRLISLQDSKSVLMSEKDIFELYQSNTKFVDVTDGDWEALSQKAPRSLSKSFPTTPGHEEETMAMIKNVNTKRMEKWLTQLTGFHTRYYKSKTGIDSANWILKQIQDLSLKTDPAVKLTVEKFEHTWGQFSIIARLSSQVEDAASDNEVIVLSAHQDSVNQWNPWFGRSPGADDDGSGSTTVFEALTILVESKFVPSKRNIEFHWYSAEEGGLLGSQKVVRSYAELEKPVFAVLHSDMTGYQPDNLEPVIGVSTEDVDEGLTESLKMIIDTYSRGIKWKDTKCGYACSDHASWTKAGYSSSFNFETTFENHSPFIHSTEDTVKHVDFKHMSSFVNVVLGFAVELSLA